MAKVIRKIAGNQFTIRTSRPGVEVSWQVTGVRQDALAERHRIMVESVKEPDKAGTYMHPSAFTDVISEETNEAIPEFEQERFWRMVSGKM